MAIDLQELNLLKFAYSKKALGRVATIGRQRLLIPKKELEQLLRLPPDYHGGDYCEELLRANFGALEVESFDYSAYEEATHICEMNKPIDIRWENNYDTVIDFGCLEHIYNVPQALRNISTICRSGGVILHVLPANDSCGHGFWQFSPELFFSLYSKVNGYQDTKVFVAHQFDGSHWYEVKCPSNGKRAVICGRNQFVIVRTIRGTYFSHENVQQSDYLDVWASGKLFPHRQSELSKRERFKSVLQHIGLLPITRFIYRLYWRFIYDRLKVSLSSRNPNLTKYSVSDLLAKS